MTIDFGRSASDYAQHRAGFPDEFFERVFNDGFVSRGERALDLGTGTGTIARGLAKRGCVVKAIDISTQLLNEASRLTRDAGLAIEYFHRSAEASGFDTQSFDVVTAGQCWHWFRRDAAATEAYRILAPGGRLIIAHFDWLPLQGSLVEETERLILRHNAAWRLAGSTGIYANWFADLSASRFVGIESFSFDIDAEYTRESWLGRIRASAGVGAMLDAAAVRAFDIDHARLIEDFYPSGVLSIPHRVFAVIGKRV